MLNEQRIFLNIISDYLNLKNTGVNTTDFDVKRLHEIAVHHQLAAIVYYQCRNDNKVKDIFFNDYLAQIANFSAIKNAKRKIELILFDVNYLFIKGAILSDLYHTPALRSMGDVDVLIQKKDRMIVDELLTKNGFVRKEIGDVVWIYNYSGIEIEVHDQLSHIGIEKDKYQYFLDDVWKYEENHTLDINYHFIYVLIHLRQHMIGKGVGFRQFLDIAFLLQCGNIDFDTIENVTINLGLFDFLKTVACFIENWFNIKSYWNYSISDDFFEEATLQIFQNGVFGFGNNWNEYVNITRIAINTGISPIKAKNKYIVNKLFPPLKAMKQLNYCKYLFDKPIMLPIAWIQRFLYRAFDKKARKTIHRQVASCDVAERRIELLNKWGL